VAPTSGFVARRVDVRGRCIDRHGARRATFHERESQGADTRPDIEESALYLRRSGDPINEQPSRWSWSLLTVPLQLPSNLLLVELLIRRAFEW
jgi:hypothetical protein